MVRYFRKCSRLIMPDGSRHPAVKRTVAKGLVPVSVLLLLFSLFLPASSDARAVVIGGSGGPITVASVMVSDYQAMHPEVQFEILPSLGSGGGIRALADGAIDIAFTSRPLNDRERTLQVKERILGVTPFVLAGNGNSGPAGISIGDLPAIYRGDIKTWPDGSPIRLVLRPKTDSDSAALRAMSPEMDKAVQAASLRKGMACAATDNENTEILYQTPGSLGSSTLAQILAEKRDLKVFSIDGVVPSPASMKEGSYHFSKVFYVVTREETAGAAASFVAYIFSPEGRSILQRLGCLQPH